MPSGIFISYARGASARAAQRLADDLLAAGTEAFLDVREIPWGAAFPATLADALLDASVVVLFAEPAYFERPWCVHELRLITAAWRAGDAAGLDGVVLALPAPGGDVAAAVAQLPPRLAAASWPHAGQPEVLAALVAEYAAKGLPSLRERLAALDDATAAHMRGGADVPLAWADAAPATAAAAPVRLTAGMPAPRGTGLVGRADALWSLVHECATARAFTPARNVVVRGLGGSGKSLLAAEFVARYAPRFFPAGVVWVDAEAGLGGLDEACARLWRAWVPGEPLPGIGAGVIDDSPAATAGRRAALAAALAERARAGVPAGRLLWVVDGLPEAGREDALGLEAWCPLLHHATVLVTTRRGDTLRDAHATLPLGPLPALAGADLLTRPPIQRSWMAPHEWDAVVRWAGGLPLVLALLREGLVDGSLALAELKAAPATEPAAATGRLMDALRGEVDDTSLRGVAQAYELSLGALEREPALAAAALRLALLAPVALSEPVLHAVVEATAVGKLVRRGWLQPLAAGGSGRSFGLHRVPASALRDRGGEFDAAFAAAFDGLAQLLGAADEAWGEARVDLHLEVLGRCFFGMPRAAGPLTLAALARLQAAAIGVDPRRRGARYLVARLANGLGSGDRFVQALQQAVPEADEAATAALPHLLQALGDSPLALDWMSRLLADPRPRVQQQALVHAPPLAPLAVPTLRAILGQPAPGDGATREAALQACPSFQTFLRAGAGLEDALAELLQALVSPTGEHVRQRAARIAGDWLEIRGRDVELGGRHGPGLVRTLLMLASRAPGHAPDSDAPEILPADDALAAELAQAAARGAEPLDDASWALLCQRVEHALPEQQPRAAAVVRHYLEAATRSRQLPDVRIERDDEGGIRLTGLLGADLRMWPPAVVPLLIDWVLRLPAAAALEAARALAAPHNQGLVEVAPWVHARLDAGEFDAVLRLADALCQVTPPSFVNAPWWRGQALAASGNDEVAARDFEAVLAASPGFEPAQQALAQACWRLARIHLGEHDFAGALPWLDRGAALRPGDFNVHHRRALALYNLERYPEAADAASRTLEIDPEVGEAWFFRAIALAAQGQTLEAWSDLVQARRWAPDDERISAYANDIEAWLRERGQL